MSSTMGEIFCRRHIKFFSQEIGFDILCKMSQIFSEYWHRSFCKFCHAVAKVTYEHETNEHRHLQQIQEFD